MEERSAMTLPDRKLIDECRDVCRPRVGVYVLTSCYGCQLSMATVQQVLEISQLVDLKCWYMTTSDSRMHEPVDIAFVEGSVSTEKDLMEIQEIRKNAEVLVAFGACAVNGGVQSWAEGDMDYDDLYSSVYGDGKIEFKGLQAAPIESYVKVDYRLPGCPPEEDEIIYFLSTFLFGSYPELRDYPVCAECRLQGNPCILIERGEPCLGPVITAGCKARCPTFDVPCIGCRGPVPHNNAWFDSLAQTFLNKGFSKDYIECRMKIFGAHDRTLAKRLKKIFGGKK